MEMVMKKYMSEVQKQNKEKNFQIVTPIRVTRSVGLQVSFLPNVSCRFFVKMRREINKMLILGEQKP